MFKKLISGSGIQSFNLVVDIAIGFLMMPFLLSYLGEENYGLWLLVGTFVGFLSVLGLGLTSAVMRFIVKDLSQGSTHGYNQTLSTSLALLIVSSALAVFISILITFLSGPLFESESLRAEFSFLIVCMGINTGLTFLESPIKAALKAEYEFTKVGTVELIKVVLRTGLTVMFVVYGFGLESLAYATLVSSLLSFVLLFSNFFKNKPEVKVALHLVSYSKLKELFNYSAKSLIIWLGDMLRFTVDNLVITSFLTLSHVTFFNIPARLISYSVQFIGATFSVYTPHFSNLIEQGQLDELKTSFSLVLDSSLFLSSLIAFLLFSLGSDFAALWVGDYSTTEWLIYILSLNLLLGSSQIPCILALYAFNKHEYYAKQNVIEGIFNLAISIILVRYWGVYGVALGTVLPMVVTKVFLQPMFCCQLIGYNLGLYYKKLLSSFTFCACLAFCIKIYQFNSDSWIWLITNAFILSVLYSSLYYLLVASKESKTSLKAILSKIRENKNE